MRFGKREASGRVGLHRRPGRAHGRLLLRATVLSCVLLAGCTGRTKRPGDAADASPDSAEADVPCGPCGCAEREAMVCVPAGSFLMGDPDPEPVFPDAPLHEVVLSAYWIDRTEVTNDAYRGCVAAGACRRMDSPPAGMEIPPDYFENPEYGAYPAVYVWWDDARAFCEWAGKRLPTEAEWEKAARGGCELRGAPDRCEPEHDAPGFPWGDAPLPDCTRANILWSCAAGPAPVGSYPAGASVYGVEDMVGNAQEWVADWYHPDTYRRAPRVDPTGPTEEEARGACVHFEPHPCRGRRSPFYRRHEDSPNPPLSHRMPNLPFRTGPHVSFRCARDADR